MWVQAVSKSLIPENYAPFERVLTLANLKRIIFVMAFLEEHTEQDCASLLRISRRRVQDAWIRALKQIVVSSLCRPHDVQ
jgi:hypothetical protein